MSELRLNPLTQEWVIIAPERGRRPLERANARPRPRVSPSKTDCPFCPGNQERTPPAVLELPSPTLASQWQVRVFPNKYPALGPAPPQINGPEGALFVSVPGEGNHEVVVETPVHNRFPADRSEKEMALMVQAYHRRYLALMSNPSIQYVVIFKNQGEQAGTSIQHPHSQIIGAPVVPERVRRTSGIASEHYRQTGRCLLCQLAEEEMRSESRVVYRDDQFLVIHPFAAARPAETWVVPLEHQPSFALATEYDLSALASALGRTLRQLGTAFDRPDFNYAIHSAPRGEEETPYCHWHLQLIPRLTRAAGFELGSGMYINPAPPEETADLMRRAKLPPASQTGG